MVGPIARTACWWLYIAITVHLCVRLMLMIINEGSRLHFAMFPCHAWGVKAQKRWGKLCRKGSTASNRFLKKSACRLRSEVVHRRDNDSAKKQHVWLMTMLWHHLVSDLCLFERVADTRKHTNTHTPTQKDTHCAFCLSHPLRAEQKSIHHGHCRLWKGSLKAPRHLVIHAPATRWNYTFQQGRSHGNSHCRLHGCPCVYEMLWSMLWDTLIAALIQIG